MGLVSDIVKIYPFDSKKALTSFKKKAEILWHRAKRANNARNYFTQLELILAALRHGHARLVDYPTKIWYRPKYLWVKWDNGRPILMRRRVKIGRIRLVDGRDPGDIIKNRIIRISGGSHAARLKRAQRLLLFSQQRIPVVIKLTAGNIIKNPRILVKNKMGKTQPIVKFVKQTAYVYIPTWRKYTLAMKDIARLVARLKKKQANTVVIDVKNNTGGDSGLATRLAAHFLDRKTSFGTMYRRKNQKTLVMKKNTYWIEPTKPHLNSKLIILIGRDSCSSSEIFISGLRDSRRALTIGAQTDGSSGRPVLKKYKSKFGTYTALIPTWINYRPNGQAIEGRGIKPDIAMELPFGPLNDKLIKQVVNTAQRADIL